MITPVENAAKGTKHNQWHNSGNCSHITQKHSGKEFTDTRCSAMPIRPETKLHEYHRAAVIQQKQEIRFRSCFYLLHALILQAAVAKWVCCACAAPLKVLLLPTPHHSQGQNQKFRKLHSSQSWGG